MARKFNLFREKEALFSVDRVYRGLVSYTVEPNKKGACGFFDSSFGILWDGKCTVCCQDFNGSIFIGDVKTSPIKKIINGDLLNNMRKMEKKSQLVNKYCQVYKGTIMKDSQKISIIKDHGLLSKTFRFANRVKLKIIK